MSDIGLRLRDMETGLAFLLGSCCGILGKEAVITQADRDADFR